MEIIVGVGFTLVGVLFLFLAGLMIYRSVRRLRDWESTTGHVVGYDESDRSVRRCYRPRVEFKARDGRTVTFAASTGSSHRSHRVGANVSILVDPANPESADLRSLSTLWLPAFFFSLFGLTFFSLGASAMLGWLN